MKSPSPARPQIVIVGGGFSGVAVAWRLLQTLPGPAQVHLVNKGALGRGLAYGTPSPHHLLNVPAGRMGLAEEDEGGFLRYLQGLGLPFGGGDFVPRSLFGSYLEWALGEARARGRSAGIQLQAHDGVAVAIEPLLQRKAPQRQTVSLHLSAGGSLMLHADAVVLALGNFPSLPPTVQPGFEWRGPGLYPTAWSARGLAPDDLDAPVLLLGSGLTALDALLQLRHEGHRGPVTMLSRRGLIAQAHRPHETPPPRGLVPPDLLKDETTVRGMLRTVRRLVAQAEAAGHDWRDVIGGLRSATPRLWQQLGELERRRFLRHLLPYWDTHRHRAAVPVAQALARERSSGLLAPMAGRLRSLTPSPEGGWRAEIEPRGRGLTRSIGVAAVINCTGPSSDLRRVNDALIRSLLETGRLRPDPLALGVEVDSAYRILDAHGKPQPGLFYVGPLLRAGLWEATAVPELRHHAKAVALSIGAYGEAGR